ncbi:MAG: prolipoprotein diacylglyceryl transferase [Dehalococcoidales bacterium]|jgi:phosphatidylglycerol:prolipoprotein diacylglycerol transferase|nr:prolipoprotein diacylglyceryl transferase [Dehalococcoidales bacterium]MDP7286297.1 prolipoprotein diacylglyceryl transferase [Dehalococcoidales bacterium]MDP7415911.1 prolipoprotein diacylglyceryl transferase [Dehalococcoidales bacterium]
MMITIDINPVAFAIGSITVRWYGIMVALAILTVVLWTAWQVRKGANVSYDTVFTVALVGIPFGVVFARLLHVIDRWEYYGQNPIEIIGGGGLTAYGAVLGTTLGIWIYSRFSKLQFAYLADVIAPGIILAQAVGRVGCLLNGCCYGIETLLPWRIVYAHPNSLCPIGMATHPTMVYEIIWNLIVFGVLVKLKGRLKPDGSLYLTYLSLYSVWRLGTDFLREGTSFLFGLHQAQAIAAIVLGIAVPLFVMRIRWVTTESKVGPEDD